MKIWIVEEYGGYKWEPLDMYDDETEGIKAVDWYSRQGLINTKYRLVQYRRTSTIRGQRQKVNK